MLTFRTQTRGLVRYIDGDGDGAMQEHWCAIMDYTFLIDGGIILWESRKQELITSLLCMLLKRPFGFNNSLARCSNLSHTQWLSMATTLQSHSLGLLFNRLSEFFSFPLSYLIFSDFEPWGDFPKGTHLSHTLYHFTNTCLSHGEPCSIKPNFILDSSFLCCAWLCCYTHVTSSCYASLPFCYHHVVASCYSVLLCLP